jgi:hypothetical protein
MAGNRCQRSKLGVLGCLGCLGLGLVDDHGWPMLLGKPSWLLALPTFCNILNISLFTQNSL